MAVFMQNHCQYRGCQANYHTLWELIYHIEQTHIDSDPIILRQKESIAPSSIPMSCILRFFPETSSKDLNIFKDVDPVLFSQSLTDLPTGKELEDVFLITSPSDDSDDSWTQTGQFTSDYILKYGKKMTMSADDDKRFVCPIPGCEKRYKNINGIKYHSINGHKAENKASKTFKCHCGKSYKTMSGLKTHSASHRIEAQELINPMLPQIQSPMTPQRLDAFTPPSPYKNYNYPTYPSNINTKFIRAALEGVLPPFNVLQNNNNNNNCFPSDYNGYVDNMGILTPAASPRPLSADKMQYPHTVLPPNPGYYPRTPVYGNYEAQHYPFLGGSQ